MGGGGVRREMRWRTEEEEGNVGDDVGNKGGRREVDESIELRADERERHRVEVVPGAWHKCTLWHAERNVDSISTTLIFHMTVMKSSMRFAWS